EQFLCFFPHLLVLLPLEQFLCFFLSGDMSTSSSAPRSTWPVYGPVPMTRCTDCPRTAPLKRLTSKEEKNGNFGREFVKCASKPEGQVRSEFSSHPLSLISQKICQIWI
uniref:Zinc finger GRF-type domain-containing protein n=1 Tax=Aegilops tauschii subsp. strangulata TaxID=200361 RepID=A0A453R3U6_AEGTS